MRWWALLVLASAQFMVIMDVSIVGVALPEMQRELGFEPGRLQWVINAYVVAFGGLLMLGGRLSDLLGARRVFVTGWVVLMAGSVLAALAESVGTEIAGRAVHLRARRRSHLAPYRQQILGQNPPPRPLVCVRGDARVVPIGARTSGASSSGASEADQPATVPFRTRPPSSLSRASSWECW